MKMNVCRYTEFGKRAKIAMIQMGLTNRDLAKMLNYKESTLCDVLKGRNRNERRIQEISEVLLSGMDKKGKGSFIIKNTSKGEKKV